MRTTADADAPTELPEVFCWTKYGTEAGETPDAILRRKEGERRANDGVFLWGIGNAVGPSVQALLEETARPQVLFTPMLSQPAARDVSPARVTRWSAGFGLDGALFQVPAGSTVVSRASDSRRSHYALVCHSTAPLVGRGHERRSFAASHVQNLRSGARVGASQVTSVVRLIACPVSASYAPYDVTFGVDLIAPYLVRLTETSYQA